MYYYEVAPTRMVRRDTDHLTYKSESALSIGTIVTIPIGKTEMVGVVVSSTACPDYDTKEITSVVENSPLPTELLDTILWISSYYSTHLATVLQTVLPRGITKTRRKSSLDTPGNHRKRTNFVFTSSQQTAIESISQQDSGSVLLHGVTGSGKTAVYIEIAKRTLRSKKSVILLVPEIALTSQLVSEFSQHFEDVIVAHSQLTESQRHHIWRETLHSNKPCVVIGPRSTLFLPLPSVGLIVVDECHEPSYKQEQSPRYSALRVATILGKKHGSRVIFGSATPAVSDYYLAEKLNTPILSMPSPARSDTVMPSIEIVDMTKRTNFSSHRFFSSALLQSITTSLANRHQILIYHNRRGTASTTLCESCGWSAGCPRCFIPLTLHADHHQLKCHICAYASRVPTSCPECRAADVIHKGIGTKLIESELRKLFPESSISRFDGDTASDSTVDKLYKQIYDGSIDIIIGTQVLAKGLDLPYLRTVGVIQADAGLSMPDYQASERTFQLLSQVVGRVGRTQHSTTVIVQTYQPTHPAILDGVSQNYKSFYDRTLAQRKRSNFPPHCFLLKLMCTYKTEKTAIKNASAMVATLRSIDPSLEILGPTPAFYERVRDTYRWQIIVKSPQRSRLQDLVTHIPPTHWQFELDPVSLL